MNRSIAVLSAIALALIAWLVTSHLQHAGITLVLR